MLLWTGKVFRWGNNQAVFTISVYGIASYDWFLIEEKRFSVILVIDSQVMEFSVCYTENVEPLSLIVLE